MNRYTQFGMRTLLIAVAVVAIVAAAIVRPMVKRHQAVEAFRTDHVHVTMAVERPYWLGSFSWFDGFFEQPVCSSVLIQPVGSTHFHVFGKDLTFDDTSAAVTNVRKKLSNELGTDRINFVQHGEFSAATMVQLWTLCEQHDTATNTCGIECFPDSALIHRKPTE